MKFQIWALALPLLLSATSHTSASALEYNVIDLDCPNLMKGTMHVSKTWDNGYLAVKDYGTFALRTSKQIDNEGAILTFSNGEVRAKILPHVKNGVVRFYLWDKGDWQVCSWK
ncbi:MULTISPECIES: hypothetical protein [Serratia]|uniref:hypothetical protein n=1 Tax=Serratia TaxID=613 RepID=UPI00197F0B41|nr:hypothetical protein [Serratia ureilytica]MBN5445565.1 hypothetical protein [Serratia ureilytica]HED2502102.1 hypothetical protein [Serratia marcescens]